MNQETLAFEKAFERLETILQTINAGKISLEESLKLFEEAEKLIRTCNRRLVDAEQKIEQLIKERDGELALGPDLQPKKEPFPYKTQ